MAFRRFLNALWQVMQPTALVVLRLEALESRLARIEARCNQLVSLSLNSAQREKTMSSAIDKLNAEIEDMKTKLDAYTTAAGKKLQEAVAEARAAQAAEDDAAIEAAIAKLDALGNTLVENGPVDDTPAPFEPSQN